MVSIYVPRFTFMHTHEHHNAPNIFRGILAVLVIVKNILLLNVEHRSVSENNHKRQFIRKIYGKFLEILPKS